MVGLPLWRLKGLRSTSPEFDFLLISVTSSRASASWLFSSYHISFIMVCLATRACRGGITHAGYSLYVDSRCDSTDTKQPYNLRHCSQSVRLSISLRVSQILPLFCSSTPLFPTTPLVYPKFPHVPLGVGGWPLGAMKSEDVTLILRALSFQDFQPMWSWSTNITDGRTDDMQSQYRTLHCSSSHGKKSYVAGKFCK